MFICRDIDDKQIYVGDMVNIWDTETKDWKRVPGTEQLLEAQVEALPSEDLVEYNPLNVGEIDVIESDKVRIVYSLIHNLLHIQSEDMEKIMAEAEERYKTTHSKGSRTGKTTRNSRKKSLIPVEKQVKVNW